MVTINMFNVIFNVNFCVFREELISSHRLTERKDGETAQIRLFIKNNKNFGVKF